jgi:hypothetical protein
MAQADIFDRIGEERELRGWIGGERTRIGRIYPLVGMMMRKNKRKAKSKTRHRSKIRV